MRANTLDLHHQKYTRLKVCCAMRYAPTMAINEGHCVHTRPAGVLPFFDHFVLDRSNQTPSGSHTLLGRVSSRIPYRKVEDDTIGTV